MSEPAAQRLAVVIEDDADVRHLLRTVLVRSGFEVVLTSNGPEGIDAVEAYDPLVTTLDVNMPGMDGFAVAKRIREFSSTYLIMLTGLDDEIDVVQGLDAGADDYLVKPFRPRELRARIEAALRRPRDRAEVPAGAADTSQTSTAEAPAPTPERAPEPVAPVAPPVREVAQEQPMAPPARHQVHPVSSPRPAPHQPEPPAPDVVRAPAAVSAAAAHSAPAVEADGWIHCKGLSLNVETRTVTVDTRPVELTRTEFDLLASLLSTGRRVRSKADLVLMLRGQDYVTTYFVNEADKRAVEVHMANLRRKIGDSSATPRWIETVRGVGYRIATES